MIRQRYGASRVALTALATGAMLAASGSASAATPPHGAPVIETAPAQPPAMTHRNGSCFIDQSNQTGKDLLWVRAHPTGMVAIWIPGLNSKRCVARRTTSGPALAERVAVAIRHAKAFPTEPLPCPYDDGTAVRLYFTYANGGDEYAGVSLDGCRPITAPDRASRWGNTTAVERPLHEAAPPAWRAYLAS